MQERRLKEPEKIETREWQRLNETLKLDPRVAGSGEV